MGDRASPRRASSPTRGPPSSWSLPTGLPWREELLQSLEDVDVVMVEVFCGCGILSKTFHQCLFGILPADDHNNKHDIKVKYLALDVTLPEDQEKLMVLICHPKVWYAHFAPPCGTASNARERKIPKHLLDMGCPEPKRLRGDGSQSTGLPGLQGTDLQRAEKANHLYYFTVRAAKEVDRRGRLWTVENPERSKCWQIPVVEDLLKSPKVFSSSHHACMHGGSRPKWQRWVSNFSRIKKLDAQCDKMHEHKPWAPDWGGEWFAATRSEAEYRELLCQRVVKIVVAELAEKFDVHPAQANHPSPPVGFRSDLPPPTDETGSAVDPTHHASQGACTESKPLSSETVAISGVAQNKCLKSAEDDPDAMLRSHRGTVTGKQPRRHGPPQLVLEFKDIVEIVVCDASDVEFVQIWQKTFNIRGL